METKENFLQYMGAAGGTILLAFVLQAGLRSCLDVGYHAKKADAPANPALVEVRSQEREALDKANIGDAMEKVASNRVASPSIKPKQSDDLSAMSGWILAPDSKPYEPEVVPAPAAN